MHFRVVYGNGLGDVLQKNGFSRAAGGATIKPRWPLPMGVNKSITRVVNGSLPVSSLIFSNGSMGVSSSKRPAGQFIGNFAFNMLDLGQTGTISFSGSLGLTGYQQPFAEAKFLNEGCGH